MKKTKTTRRLKIKKRIRSKIFGTNERPRLSVFKSNQAISVQLVDDKNAHTLVSASSRELNSSAKNYNVKVAHEVGKLLAQKAKDANIEQIVFDRNGYLYHGRVKALADGAREGGLQF